MECEVESVNDAWSVKCRAWSVKCGVWSVEWTV